MNLFKLKKLFFYLNPSKNYENMSLKTISTTLLKYFYKSIIIISNFFPFNFEVFNKFVNLYVQYLKIRF